MKTHDEQADLEAKRVVELLALLIRISGRSLRSIEAELGLGSSVLSKILSGVIRPQLSYVLLICSAVGISPGHFFRLAYPHPGPAGPLVEQYLESQGNREKDGKVASDLDQKVREALFRVLDELRGLKS